MSVGVDVGIGFRVWAGMGMLAVRTPAAQGPIAQTDGKPAKQHRSIGAIGIRTKDNLRAWNAFEKITDCVAQVLQRLTSGEQEEHH